MTVGLHAQEIPDNQTTPSPIIGIKLLTPAAGAEQQNGRDGGKEGSVIAIEFCWTSVPGADAYRLQVKRLQSTYALIDTTVTSTSYRFMRYGSYVVAQNRRGWWWQVTALRNGQPITVSEERAFSFGPVWDIGEAASGSFDDAMPRMILQPLPGVTNSVADQTRGTQTIVIDEAEAQHRPEAEAAQNTDRRHQAEALRREADFLERLGRFAEAEALRKQAMELERNRPQSRPNSMVRPVHLPQHGRVERLMEGIFESIFSP